MTTELTRVATRCVAICVIAVAASTVAYADSPSEALTPIGRDAYARLFGAAPSVFELPAIEEFSFQQQKPPEPHHTGFQALVRSTASDFKTFPQRTSTWVILGIGGAAAALIHPFDDDISEELPKHDNLKKVFAPGKYLGYTWVQMGASIGTYVIGRYYYHPAEGKTNRVSHLGFDLLRANLLTTALTYGVKYGVRRDRPDGTCCAFPSGHASVTFASASVLERHFGYRAAWPTFVIAGYVSASRLTDNKHFASDVLFGAALGMASGWTVVGRHGRDDFAMYPVMLRGGAGVMMTWAPGGPHTGSSAEGP
jgi:membrane-associated phospholipid phosphatase